MNSIQTVKQFLDEYGKDAEVVQEGNEIIVKFNLYLKKFAKLLKVIQDHGGEYNIASTYPDSYLKIPIDSLSLILRERSEQT